MKKKLLINFIICLISLSVPIYGQTTILMEKQGTVYVIPCKVNGLPLKFIFDTGASDVSISLIEALFMLKNGYLKEKDIIGTEHYKIANGDIVEGTRIILEEIEIGGIKLKNVEASVDNQIKAPLLLGQSAIQKLGKIQVEGNILTILNSKVNNDDKSNSQIVNTLPTQDKSNCGGSANMSALAAYENGINKANKKADRLVFLQQAMDLDANYTDAIFAYAMERIKTLIYQDSPFKPTESYFKKVIDLCPQYHSNCYYYLCFIYYEDQNWTLAEKYSKLFIDFKSGDVNKFDKSYENFLSQATQMYKYSKEASALKNNKEPH